MVLREGNIVQYDSPKKIVENEKDEYIKELLGENVNFYKS